MGTLTISGGTPREIEGCFKRWNEEQEEIKNTQKSTTTSKKKSGHNSRFKKDGNEDNK